VIQRNALQSWKSSPDVEIIVFGDDEARQKSAAKFARARPEVSLSARHERLDSIFGRAQQIAKHQTSVTQLRHHPHAGFSEAHRSSLPGTPKPYVAAVGYGHHDLCIWKVPIGATNRFFAKRQGVHASITKKTLTTSFSPRSLQKSSLVIGRICDHWLSAKLRRSAPRRGCF